MASEMSTSQYAFLGTSLVDGADGYAFFLFSFLGHLNSRNLVCSALLELRKHICLGRVLRILGRDVLTQRHHMMVAAL